MEDNDGFIPLKKNENGVFTPVEDDGFIPVTKTSDGIFVSADEKKKSVANQSDTQPVSQVPSERPMSPSSESGQEDKGILNKIGDAFSGAWNKVLSGQGLFGTERETLAQQKQLEQRQNAIDLAIAKRNETERLKNEAVQKSDLVRENLKQYKAESDAVEYAAQFPEYKQLQQIDASISAIGKPSNPQQQAQYNALLAEREKLLDTDVSKRDVFAESGPKLEIKNPSDFATASEYADYQNKLFNQFSRFSKEKEKFDTAKPKFEAATKLRDVLDVAQKSQTKASWIADKVKSIQKESDDYINAARELNKDRLEPLGFTKAFVDGIQQTSLANSIADIYALGNDDKLLKSLENIYIDNTVFPKETTTLGSLGELIGGQVEPLAIGVGGGAINPIAGVVGATAEYARLGAGGQLIDAYNTARQQGMTAPEALEVAKKTAVAGAVGGAAEGLAGATFGGKPAKELATMGFKQAVKEALKDNSIDAVIAGINQTVQNKNMQRLGLDVETDRGVIENMGAELLFGAGMNLAMYGGSKVKGYGTLINGIAKMPLADIQLQVDNAVKQGVLNEANAQRFVADVAKSKEAQDKLQGVDIPEANQDKAIDLQKEIDELEAKKKTASPAILPAIESKVEALTGELQIVAGVPLTMQEKAELNRLQTARDTNTEYDKDRLGVLEARQKAASEKQVITEPKIETNAEEQQSGTLRSESEQVQAEGERNSDMPIVNEAKLQDGQVVEEVAPPVVEQTTTDGLKVEGEREVAPTETVSEAVVEQPKSEVSTVSGEGVSGSALKDVEGKKADIERRRQEELNIFSVGNKINRYDSSGKFQDIVEVVENRPTQIRFKQDDGSFINKNKNQLNFDAKINTQASYRVLDFDEINAKYDAELAALEESEGVSGSALKDKKADIERRRQIGEDVLAELNKQFSDIHLSGGEAIIDGTWDGDFRGKGNQTLEVDENENIVLRRGARDEQSLTKSDLQFTNREDLYSSSTTNGIGNGVPTASNSEVGEDYKYSSNLMGVFKIPYQDFLNLVKEGKIGLGNIGESEIVISPDVAQKYLYSINGKINAKYDAELATLEKQQSGKEAPTQYTEAAGGSALKDVESTAKALEGVKFNANFNLPLEQTKSPKQVSEAYHKAKADGSNPELVQAVEQLLTPTTTGQGTQAEVTTTPQAGSVVGGEIKSNWNYEGEGDAFASNKDSRDGKSAYTIRILDRNGRGRSYNRAKQRGELDTKSPLTYEGDKESISAIDGNGNTVGVIKLQTDGGVEHIVVAPEFSRKGVASELIKQIEQKGAKVNFEKSKLISPDAAKLFNKIRSEQSLKKEPTKQPSSEETMVGKTVTFEHAGSEKSGVVQVGEMPKPKNEYKTSTEKTLMPDGEEGVIVTIEKPDGEKVVLDAMYPEDVESEVTKKIRGFKLSQTEKPKVLEVQPQVAKNVGDVISFEHAGSEHTGKIVSIDANGNYKVRDKNGVNYTVKEDGVIEQSEIDAAKSDFFNALNEYKNATDVTKLGFALDPEKQAEAMFKVHKSLVNLAKAYISKGVSDVKKFAKQVGVSAKNAQQAWDEAMGRIKYTKDTVDYDLAEITKTAIRRGIDVRKKFSDYKSKQADISKAISDFMQDAEIRSVLNTQQVKALVSKAASVTNESQLNKFIDYAEKVISDSEYVSDMDEIRNMQQKARKRNHVSFNGIVNEFTSINPENIPDHLLLDYKAAMDDLMGRVPSYKKMGEIFYEIQSANQKPDTFSNVKTYQQAQELYNAIALNKVSSIEEYRKLFQDINGFKRRVEQLFENGDITQDQRDDLIEQVGNDQKTVEDKYASEITSLKTDLINEIRAKQKSTGISQLSTEEKKLLDRFYKLDNDDLRSLSPEELYNLSSILDNVMEEGRVDTFRLSPLVQKAEASFEANELSSQINKAKPFSEQFNDIKEAVKKMGMTYSSFWENTLGLGAVNYGAFQKYVISPMEKAIAEYRRDVNAGYEAFNNAKKKYGIGEKEMDKIGMIAHYLREYGMQNHPRYKGKKDSKGNVIGTRDWFEFMISDAETKGKLGVDKVNELKKIWDGLPKINGKVSPEDVYNSFVNGDSRFLSSNELSFLKDVMKWQSENMTGRQKFSNELRGNPFEELMFHIKRVRKGETKSQASTPVEVSGKTGNVRIAAGSGKEVTSEEMGAIETNFEKLFAETIEENSRDYHLTQMLQKQNEVLNKARQSVSDDKKNYIDAMKQNLASAVNYEFEQSKVGKIGKVLKNLMQAKAAQVLIAPIRTVGEVGAALISYPARAKAFAAYKELFTKKDAVKNLMQQTNSPYLSKVDLSRQFDIGKKGIEQESTFSKLSELFAAFPERMGIEPVWMAVFDQSFKKETGVDFDRGKYINDPSYSQKFDKQIKAAGSVADATYGQISGGTTRAGQRREIRILPDMVSKSFGGIKANSTAGNIASFMTGYPFREVEQILKSGSALAEASKGEEYTKGDVAKQLAPIIGTVLSATAYNYWQALQYQLSRIALGDDEEKEKAQKDIENLFSLSGATMETASSLAATLGSRYSGLSRNGMAWLGSLYYNVEDDAKRKQVAKDFVRNITFQEPFELQRKKSGEVNKYMLKEKISLQAVNAVAPFAAFTDNAYKAVNSVGGWDYLVKKVEKGELLTEPEKSAIIATYVAVNMGNALVQLFGYGIPNTTINKMAKEILKKGKSSSSTQDKSEANPTPSSRFSPNVPPIQLPSRKNIYIDLAKNKP